MNFGICVVSDKDKIFLASLSMFSTSLLCKFHEVAPLDIVTFIPLEKQNLKFKSSNLFDNLIIRQVFVIKFI